MFSRLLSPSSTRNRSVPHVQVLGKIPSYPEFIHRHTPFEPVQSFDAWVEGGVSLAGMRHGPAFAPAFDAGAPYAFIWRAPRAARVDDVLCGVLIPSRDSVGRHFPLSVVMTTPPSVIVAAPPMMPLAFAEFIAAAYYAATESFDRMPDDLTRRIHAVAMPGAEHVLRAAQDYESWCRETHFGGAWAGAFPDRTYERAVAVIESLACVLKPLRGVEAPAQGPIVRLPLGQAGPVAAALWLDIVCRLCGRAKTVPSAFWSHKELVVTLGDAPLPLFANLWIWDPMAEGTYDLTSLALPADGWVDSMPPSRVHAIPPDASMAEVLAMLSR
jgi:type VI secretion system protein ImpM